MSILTQDFVRDAINAEKAGCEFPVYFDDVWQEIGYSRKDSAKRSLINSPLKHGIDYHIHNNVEMVNSPQTSNSEKPSHLLNNEQMVKRPQGGGPQPEIIVLTLDGFKHFCLSAQTEKGYELRQYFIEIEKAYREYLERQLLASVGASIADNTHYNITFWKVHQDSGIVDPWYVRNVILAKYDHRMVNDLICVTQKTYEDLLENFRSQAGTEIGNLPPEKQAKFKRGETSKKNRREPQQRDDGQLNLF